MEKRNEEVLSAKREAGIRQIELTQELAEKTEQIRNLAKREEAALEDAAAYRYRYRIIQK